MGPFSVTGQPNAMGGREVGGLANLLAAHMDIDNAVHRDLVQRFWRSPTIATRPGLKAVDMFRPFRTGGSRRCGSCRPTRLPPCRRLILCAPPLPPVPFVVVSDISAQTDTSPSPMSNCPLPVGRKGRHGHQFRAAHFPPACLSCAARRSDARLAADCRSCKAHGLLYSGFGWTDVSQVFAEHAALSGFENSGSRDFDISATASLDRDGYDALAPFPMALVERRDRSRPRFFRPMAASSTPDGKARAVPIRTSKTFRRLSEGRFTLNTGRIRDQWHTMTRTGLSARLSSHLAEPFLRNPSR